MDFFLCFRPYSHTSYFRETSRERRLLFFSVEIGGTGFEFSTSGADAMLARLKNRIDRSVYDKTEAEKMVADYHGQIERKKTDLASYEWASADSGDIAALTNPRKPNTLELHDYPPNIQRFGLQLYRTALTEFVIGAIRVDDHVTREKKTEIVLKIMEEWKVEGEDCTPLKQLFLSSSLNIGTSTKSDRERINAIMTEYPEGGSLLEYLKEKHLVADNVKVEVMTGGGMVLIPYGMFDSFQIRNAGFDEKTGKYFAMMDNGCEGNLLTITQEGSDRRAADDGAASGHDIPSSDASSAGDDSGRATDGDDRRADAVPIVPRSESRMPSESRDVQEARTGGEAPLTLFTLKIGDLDIAHLPFDVAQILSLNVGEGDSRESIAKLTVNEIEFDERGQLKVLKLTDLRGAVTDPELRKKLFAITGNRDLIAMSEMLNGFEFRDGAVRWLYYNNPTVSLSLLPQSIRSSLVSMDTQSNEDTIEPFQLRDFPQLKSINAEGDKENVPTENRDKLMYFNGKFVNMDEIRSESLPSGQEVIGLLPIAPESTEAERTKALAIVTTALKLAKDQNKVFEEKLFDGSKEQEYNKSLLQDINANDYDFNGLMANDTQSRITFVAEVVELFKEAGLRPPKTLAEISGLNPQGGVEYDYRNKGKAENARVIGIVRSYISSLPQPDKIQHDIRDRERWIKGYQLHLEAQQNPVVGIVTDSNGITFAAGQDDGATITYKNRDDNAHSLRFSGPGPVFLFSDNSQYFHSGDIYVTQIGENRLEMRSSYPQRVVQIGEDILAIPADSVWVDPEHGDLSDSSDDLAINSEHSESGLDVIGKVLYDFAPSYEEKLYLAARAAILGPQQFLATDGEKYFQRAKARMDELYDTSEKKLVLLRTLGQAISSIQPGQIDFTAGTRDSNGDELFVNEDYENNWNDLQKFCFRRERQISGFTVWLSGKLQEYRAEIASPH